MDIEKILSEAFFTAARQQNINLTSTEMNNLKRQFNLYAVQQAVDNDIETIKREYRQYPALQRREIEKKERLHRSNLRKLAQDYASILAKEKITYLTESKAGSTRSILKASAAKPCDAYPC